MLVNKLIIFLENMLDEDINYDYFQSKLTFDLNFINTCMDDFWLEYLKFYDLYRKDNFVKTYTFLLKRFNKLLTIIIKNKTIITNFKLDTTMLDVFIDNVRNKLETVSDHNIRLKLAKTEGQCINEEEYMLLLNDLNEDN